MQQLNCVSLLLCLSVLLAALSPFVAAARREARSSLEAVKGGEEVIRREEVHFSGRIPFTADYHTIHRHPPKHN
ncbi:uncharacterized protein LOC133917414 [Phragmites australis]|uniref:uncharacterized protein LOC133917414 n=1 Tax=Phragmites australis TaxID=29695 RepID=UPI002D770470|nr:uncharacterized protein LOC133917414 [Phragmites australis]